MSTDPTDAPRAPLGVTWVGHATVTLDLHGARVLIDPLLKRHNGPLRRRFPMPSPEVYRGTDAILISHLHHDHAELPSLRLLPGVPVLTAPENAAWVRRQGLRGVDLGEDWVPVGTGDVVVRLAPAVHGHRPMPHRPNAANSHLIKSRDWRIWAVGDTELFDEMRLVPHQLGGAPDLVLVPIAGWGPRLSGGHLDPEQAAEVCARTRASRALAVHWGTLHPPIIHRGTAPWIDRPHPAFARALERIAPECELIDLRPGESTVVE
ncbi:MBL fold metallo-hydrolase [Nocardioides sp. YIM 152588]|uniref:MBL fold metallo-hydrolase n=1 Tax=Nocardioides sp. YIM 152588 TaxID=3158259 RepID=UPI0032E36B35